jgi:RNA-binding protein
MVDKPKHHMEFASVRSVTISTLSHATEDRVKVLKAMRELYSGTVLKEFPAAKAKGHYGNEIVILRTTITLGREADMFFIELWRRLGESEREQVLSRLGDHIDQSGTLFLRIDKEECFQGRVRIGTMDTIRVEVHFSVNSSSPGGVTRSIEQRLGTIV